MTDKNLIRVDPINTRRVDGSYIRDRYTFGKVHVDDIPRDFQQSGVNFKKGKDRVRWQYKAKVPILIDERGALAKNDVNMEEAQNQAFFALSILADSGYVSGWEKR